jgi:hypothetical protein
VTAFDDDNRDDLCASDNRDDRFPILRGSPAHTEVVFSPSTPERRHVELLKKLGVSHEVLFSNLADLATRGVRREVVRDGEGKILHEKIIEDPAIRLKATEKLLEYLDERPRSIKRGYVEEIEW